MRRSVRLGLLTVLACGVLAAPLAAQGQCVFGADEPHPCCAGTDRHDASARTCCGEGASEAVGTRGLAAADCGCDHRTSPPPALESVPRSVQGDPEAQSAGAVLHETDVGVPPPPRRQPDGTDTRVRGTAPPIFLAVRALLI